MSLSGDLAKDDDIAFVCQKIKEKINKYPEASGALKELGIEILETLPNIPEWSHGFRELFRRE